MPNQPVYPWGPKVRTEPAPETTVRQAEASDAEPMALEQALDSWSVDHLDAAIAVQEIVREHLNKTSYRQIGKTIAHLELPDEQAEP